MKENNHVKIFFTAILFITVSATLLFSQTKWPDFYNQAPKIQIKDPMASLVGSLPEGQNILTIHLSDVAMYSGHVCPGIASGYTLVRKALQALYPNSMPERGQIRVAAMAPSDLMDVASYITGARSFYGRDEINANDLVVDKSLTPKKPVGYVMVFQRKDNGKAVKATFNKFKLMPPQKFQMMKAFFGKMLKGHVSQKEKEQKWNMIQAMVKQLVINPKEGVFTVRPLKGYHFPKSKISLR